MSFHHIFPDIVYKTKIADSEIIKKEFADKIINKFLHAPNEQADWGRLCDTWQVPANKEIEKLYYLYFEKHIAEWFRYFGFPDLNFRTDMWINVHTYNMYQEIHSHIAPNVILCGNYNLQLNEKDSPLLFCKRNKYLDIMSSFIPLENTSKIDMNAVEGDLLLFSPDQEHFVPRAKEKHDGHRITISFNVRST